MFTLFNKYITMGQAREILDKEFNFYQDIWDPYLAKDDYLHHQLMSLVSHFYGTDAFYDPPRKLELIRHWVIPAGATRVFCDRSNRFDWSENYSCIYNLHTKEIWYRNICVKKKDLMDAIQKLSTTLKMTNEELDAYKQKEFEKQWATFKKNAKKKMTL